MPPEVAPDQFLCNENCSLVPNEDINVFAWYTHVLPQLRERKWYGYSVREFIQGPGETIYMPGNLAHAIMNIDENVSITENYFLSDCLDDWVHGMMTGEMLFDDESNGSDELKFWKQMYFKHLLKEDRKEVRAMRDQIEVMVNAKGDACNITKEDQDYDYDDEVMSNDLL